MIFSLEYNYKNKIWYAQEAPAYYFGFTILDDPDRLIYVGY